jgi:thiol-disulfide isomerase/thioredoxin
MKKLSIFCWALIASLVMMSCGGSSDSKSGHKIKLNGKTSESRESQNNDDEDYEEDEDYEDEDDYDEDDYDEDDSADEPSGDAISEFGKVNEEYQRKNDPYIYVEWADKWAKKRNLSPNAMACISTAYYFASLLLVDEKGEGNEEVMQVLLKLATCHNEYRDSEGYRNFILNSKSLGKDALNNFDSFADMYASKNNSSCNGGSCSNGGRNGGRNGGGSVIECTDGMFSSIRPGKPYIIDYNATWCGPCQQLRPVLEGLQDSYGSAIQIYSVDIDQCPNAANSRGIESLPTLEFYDANGRLVKKTVGYLQESEIRRILSQAGVR